MKEDYEDDREIDHDYERELEEKRQFEADFYD